ncbi:NAD(P)-dependent alcohol dehydrogenase [Myxococcus qinghaiensis]|uniref:NAD(P)-dependent alcohol dehydrogenase n=1 Tax=Myxococcus qinghaiensis TaxID=2906758 RepID=UPI0020A81673|nr:NAD(P)-dependent alcohol dehydrogenase [Myxococcus qinghaiensis]MCP3164298.1 NAD(P)-dependent alcohol dehydrogenase [Myxococcus qinghaiensis]
MSEQAQARAAVVWKKGGPFQLEDVTIEAPQADEVLVRMVATGMCHTDMIVRDQFYPVPLPVVLGHEGAGVVERVGSRVTKVAPGDHVVMAFTFCGRCDLCQSGHPAYCREFFARNLGGGRMDGSTAVQKEGKPLHDHFFGQSSFSTFAIATERNIVKVRKDVPLELLGPLGCGISTGAGAVLNSLKVTAGRTFAAFGSGAVGLSAVMAARLAGATTIIAVDTRPNRLQLALELGATHVVNGQDEDAVAFIKRVTGDKGVDFTLESTGNPKVLRQAIDSLDLLGTCGVVGAPPFGTEASFDVNDLMIPGKSVRGIVEGDSVPDVFIPQLIDLYSQGKFPFDKLARFYPLEQINQAAKDSEKGDTLKPIIRMTRPG